MTQSALGHQLPHLQIMSSWGGEGCGGNGCARGRNPLIHGDCGHHGGSGLGQGGWNNNGHSLG